MVYEEGMRNQSRMIFVSMKKYFVEREFNYAK